MKHAECCASVAREDIVNETKDRMIAVVDQQLADLAKSKALPEKHQEQPLFCSKYVLSDFSPAQLHTVRAFIDSFWPVLDSTTSRSR
ncbi:MAG: hypothetical protein IPO08_18385 [Xanthomonadales bacterium]|nr:hypothetical protein [Xanthomonadales bacterium]